MNLIKGYIPYDTNTEKFHKKIIIISHGLGSSKKSPTALRLMEKLDENKTGYIAYDFTAHGENFAADRHFGVKNCIEDLENVYNFVKEKFPEAEIYFFSSSFGAYINLLFLNKHSDIKTKSFLRSAAVSFPNLIFDNTTKAQEREMAENGYCIMDMGYVRPIKIFPEFLDELRVYNVFAVKSFPNAEIKMIHGKSDETAPFSEALRFAQKYGAKLVPVLNGQHRLMEEEQILTVLKEALEFYK